MLLLSEYVLDVLQKLRFKDFLNYDISDKNTSFLHDI